MQHNTVGEPRPHQLRGNELAFLKSFTKNRLGSFAFKLKR